MYISHCVRHLMRNVSIKTGLHSGHKTTTVCLVCMRVRNFKLKLCVVLYLCMFKVTNMSNYRMTFRMFPLGSMFNHHITFYHRYSYIHQTPSSCFGHLNFANQLYMHEYDSSDSFEWTKLYDDSNSIQKFLYFIDYDVIVI